MKILWSLTLSISVLCIRLPTKRIMSGVNKCNLMFIEFIVYLPKNIQEFICIIILTEDW